MKSCPCHSGKEYESCCAPYHRGACPPDALALMRSRYSAYALNQAHYIIETTHPDHPDAALPLAQRIAQVESFSKDTLFQDLEILEFSESKNQAIVTFKAILFQKNHNISFTEKSAFKCIHGRWYYLSALSIQTDKSNQSQE